MADRGTYKVLIVDDDRDVAELVRAVLTDEGYLVSVLADVGTEQLRVAVERLEPDCVLLDGERRAGPHGAPWLDAAWLRARARPVPAVLFTGRWRSAEEATRGMSARSRAAGFAAVVRKPFELQDLLAAVGRCVGSAPRPDGGEPTEAEQAATLVGKLRAAGAQDVRVAAGRQAATFTTADGTRVQLYRWARGGAYYVARFVAAGRVQPVGEFSDLDAAIAVATAARGKETP